MRKQIVLLILGWFRFWAKVQLLKNRPKVIGLTGSAGKTTTRNAIYAVLRDSYQVKVSYKANSESGIPLNILGIKPHTFSPTDWLRMILQAPLCVITNWERYDAYIVEMGIDSPNPPKNMEYLLTILKPDIGVFLNAMAVHTAFFSNKRVNGKSDRETAVDWIAREKGKLIESLPESGLAVLNLDDERVMKSAKNTNARVKTFGKSQDSTVRYQSWSINGEQTQFTFKSGNELDYINLPYLLPEHYGYSFGAALCVCIHEKIGLETGCNRIETHFKLPPGRASLFQGINGSTIIDSSYNSSPGPMLDMLALLEKVQASRKLCLLGDMRELEAESDELHEEVIRKALHVCEHIFLVGPIMRKNGIAGAVWCETAAKAATVIKPVLQPGDVLLVKGSQNTIFLETAVEHLLADPADATKLCRRGDFWEKKREEMHSYIAAKQDLTSNM